MEGVQKYTGCPRPACAVLPPLMRSPGVLAAVADERKSVVASGAHEIELVTAARAVLDCPQIAGVRIERCALDVSQPIRKDFGPHARATGRNGLLRGIEPSGLILQHLAVGVAETLRLLVHRARHRRRRRGCDQQRAIAREHQIADCRLRG